MTIDNDPLLLLDDARDLPDGRVVVSGPSFGGAWFRWASKDAAEVKLVNPTAPGVSVAARLSKAGPGDFSSDEMFGFDPFSTEFPRLRSLQSYTAVILSLVDRPTPILGSFLLPAHATPSIQRSRLRITLTIPEQDYPLLLEEFSRIDDQDEKLVFRLETSTSNGFLAIAAQPFCRGPSIDIEGTLVSFPPQTVNASGNLYSLRSHRLPGKPRRYEWRKDLLGTCRPLMG